MLAFEPEAKLTLNVSMLLIALTLSLDGRLALVRSLQTQVFVPARNEADRPRSDWERFRVIAQEAASMRRAIHWSDGMQNTSEIQFNKILLEPRRLAVVVCLGRLGGEATFAAVRDAIGAPANSLSMHLTRLETAGLVRIEKRFRGRRPLTFLHLTEEARRTLAALGDMLSSVEVAA